MNVVAWLVFLFAALIEVGGDAVIRRGLRGRTAAWILLGCAMLAFYGVMVNTLKWDFSRMLGVYVCFFAVASVLYGRFMFQEEIPAATWCGLALIILGGMFIQFGRK